MYRLTIVGGGPGSAEYMLPKAMDAVRAAGYVFADDRYMDLVPHSRREPFGKMSQMPGKIRHKLAECNVAVIVSGDPLFYSLTKMLFVHIPQENIEIIPGISSTSYLAAKCGRTTENALFVSSHGREAAVDTLAADLLAGKDVYMLCDHSHGPDWLAGELCRRGLSWMPMAAGSRLSYPDEQISQGNAASFCGRSFDKLCVAAAFGNSCISGMGQEKCAKDFVLLPDRAFIRDKVPMTREEIRWVIMGKIGIFPGATVWDIGAGTGSISVECARLLRNFGSGHVYSIERNPNAVELIKKNKEQFHLDNMTVLLGNAIEQIKSLPVPDCVFIGGSGKELANLLGMIGRLKRGIRVVTACVTLETFYEAGNAYKALAYDDTDMVQLQISRAKTLGSYHIMDASHPVTLYYGITGGEQE